MPDAPAALNPPDRRARLDPAAGAAVLLAGVAFYLRFGYAYGVEDHDDLLPELVHRLDPSLFARDPFVTDRLAGVSVREGFVALLYGPSVLLGVPAAVALLYVIAFAATAWGVYRLTRVLLPNLPLAALAAPTVALAVLPLWTLGQNTLAYSYLVPEGIAWALVLPALAGAARGRVLLPAVLVGLAGWIHSVTALTVAGALTLAMALRGTDAGARREALINAVAFAGTFALVSAPMVVRVILGQAGEAAGASPTGYDLFVRLRLPHHLLPIAFPPASWARFALVAAVGSLALLWLHRQQHLRHGAFAARFLAGAAGLCIIAVIGVVVFESLAVARAQAFKLTVLANVLLVIGLCGGVSALVERAPAQLRSAATWPARAPNVALAVAAALAIAVGVAAFTGIGRPGRMYGPRGHRLSDTGRVEAWALRRTPIDALFIVPPANTSFRVGARRSAYVTWKAHPFRADRMRVWLENLLTVAPAPFDDGAGGWAYRAAIDDAYCANDARDWQRIARRTNGDYAIVEAGCRPPGTAAAFSAGALAVYPLRP